MHLNIVSCWFEHGLFKKQQELRLKSNGTVVNVWFWNFLLDVSSHSYQHSKSKLSSVLDIGTSRLGLGVWSANTLANGKTASISFWVGRGSVVDMMCMFLEVLFSSKIAIFIRCILLSRRLGSLVAIVLSLFCMYNHSILLDCSPQLGILQTKFVDLCRKQLLDGKTCKYAPHSSADYARLIILRRLPYYNVALSGHTFVVDQEYTHTLWPVYLLYSEHKLDQLCERIVYNLHLVDRNLIRHNWQDGYI